MNVFGIGLPEFGMLLVLAVVLFGPERIPEMSRKAARVVYFLRNIANNAQDQLRAELGPEYADLDIRDLNPKTFVQKHLLDQIQGDLDEIKADLDGVRNDLDSELKDARMLTEDIRHDLERSGASQVDAGPTVPDYADAT